MKYNELPEQDQARFRELINKYGFDYIAENNKYFDSAVKDRFGYIVKYIGGEFIFKETEKNEQGFFKTRVLISDKKETKKNDEPLINLIEKMTNTKAVPLMDGKSVLFLDNDFKRSFVWNKYNGHVTSYRIKFEEI